MAYILDSAKLSYLQSKKFCLSSGFLNKARKTSLSTHFIQKIVLEEYNNII